MLATSSFGLKENPALIFLHGFLGCKEDFEEIVSCLQQDYFCLCLDLPGHGKSPLYEDVFSAILFSLRMFSLKDPVLVGYSLGGRISLNLTAKNKELFKAQILLSCHPGIHDKEQKKIRWEQDKKWIDRLKSLPFEEFLSLWYQQPIFTTLSEKKDLFEKTLTRRRNNRPKDLAKILERLSLAKIDSALSIETSSFFLYGEHDKKYEKIYYENLSKTQTGKILYSGHAVHLENPHGTAEQINKWLKENYGKN